MELFTRQRPEDHFSITPVVVLLSLFVSMVIGEAVSLSLSLAVGLAIGATVFVLQVAFFGQCSIIFLESPSYSHVILIIV